jgi:hypothetical protein
MRHIFNVFLNHAAKYNIEGLIIPLLLLLSNIGYGCYLLTPYDCPFVLPQAPYTVPLIIIQITP